MMLAANDDIAAKDQVCQAVRIACGLTLCGSAAPESGVGCKRRVGLTPWNLLNPEIRKRSPGRFRYPDPKELCLGVSPKEKLLPLALNIGSRHVDIVVYSIEIGVVVLRVDKYLVSEHPDDFSEGGVSGGDSMT